MVYVLESLRQTGKNPAECNLTTQERIIERAGVTAWPKLWHNLRSSRQTELTEDFPAHVVSAWLGNSERIATQHYLQVLDSHFDKATRQTTRTVPEPMRLDVHGVHKNEETPYFQGVSALGMGDIGLEPMTSIL